MTDTDTGATAELKFEELPEHWRKELRAVRDECARRRSSENALTA
ncbi:MULTISPECIES: hypothetical protein [unclassified Pseudonocardia]|nr:MULTISPECIES: hypothetical protein [unclassified Pseudonocardia]